MANPMLSRDIAKYLGAVSSVPVTYSETGATGAIFVEKMPQAPDTAVAITSYSGPESDGKLGYDEPRFQVRVRGGSDPTAPALLAQQIYDALHGLGPVTLPLGTLLLSCYAMGQPQTLGQDTANRFEYVVNFRTEVRNTAGGRQ